MKKMKALEGLEILERATVERLAEIIGENSAAKQALGSAANYKDPVFLRYRGGIFVTESENVRLDPKRETDAIPK